MYAVRYWIVNHVEKPEEFLDRLTMPPINEDSPEQAEREMDAFAALMGLAGK